MLTTKLPFKAKHLFICVKVRGTASHQPHYSYTEELMDSFGVSYQPAELIDFCQHSIQKGHFDCNCSDVDDNIRSIINIYHDDNRELCYQS